MTDVPIIGQDDSTAAARNPDVHVLETAFVVGLHMESGQWVALNLETPVETLRTCTSNDVRAGCQGVVDDMMAQLVAGRVVAAQMSLAVQSKQAADAAALRAQLKL